jgi:hypothetical protein
VVPKCLNFNLFNTSGPSDTEPNEKAQWLQSIIEKGASFMQPQAFKRQVSSTDLSQGEEEKSNALMRENYK